LVPFALHNDQAINYFKTMNPGSFKGRLQFRRSIRVTHLQCAPLPLDSACENPLLQACLALHIHHISLPPNLQNGKHRTTIPKLFKYSALERIRESEKLQRCQHTEPQFNCILENNKFMKLKTRAYPL